MGLSTMVLPVGVILIQMEIRCGQEWKSPTGAVTSFLKTRMEPCNMNQNSRNYMGGDILGRILNKDDGSI
jgi:hypothetical protein